MSPPEPGGLRGRAEQRARRAIAARSDLAFGFFGRIFERSLQKDFHALRLSRAQAPPDAALPALVIYSNHPSWWDAITYVVIARHLFAGRKVFAPIDATMLQRYGFLGRIGAFGVEQGTGRGAADFLAAARAILGEAGGMLMITAQGRFADVRQRPLRLAPGLAHLAALRADVHFAPMAVEYTHWDERRPEMLLRFGPVIAGAGLSDLPVEARSGRLEAALAETMDALAQESINRNPEAFDLLLAGSGGINPLYDVWRRMKALASGKSFNPEHGAGGQ